MSLSLMKLDNVSETDEDKESSVTSKTIDQEESKEKMRPTSTFEAISSDSAVIEESHFKELIIPRT